MFRPIVVFLACTILSGCSDTFLSASEKINKAFAPIAEVRVAEESLRTLLQPDTAAIKVFEQQYAARLELRALTCGQGVTVGRFDSVDKVKQLAIKRDCLNEQDTLLLQYLGIRQIGLRLAQPALRPLLPLGPPRMIHTGGGPELSNAFAASAAGVAVLTGTRGEMLSVEIPGGKKIATLGQVPGSVSTVLVSPNGRVVAIRPQTDSLIFVDAETGSKLWETKILKRFYAWLPEVSAALASDTKTGAMALIDFQAGTVAAHPVALREPAWAMTVSTAPSRVLVGSARLFSLIEHSRSKLEIKTSIIKELQITQGQSMPSEAPTLMLGGASIVFTASPNLMAMSLETGAETVLSSGDLFAGRYAKLSESTLLVQTRGHDMSGVKAAVFDIKNVTLAPLMPGEAGNGNVTTLTGRTGFLRTSYQEMWFGDTVKAGEPVSLESWANAVNLLKQIARLEAASQENALHDQDAAPGAAAVAIAVADSNTASRAFGTPSRVTPELGQDRFLAGMARSARLEAVGVYQGSAATAGAQGQRKIGNVEVRVRRGKPVILVLSSYEPVRWKVVMESGASVVGVLVSGYYQSEVTGAGNARIIVRGSSYAYEAGSAQLTGLYRQTAVTTGKIIDSFQGKYEGSLFTVGGK